MSPLIDWYFEVCRSQKDEVIVLIQVGGFYEAYSDDKGNGSAKKLSEVLRMHLTKKNSKKPLCRSTNPFMAGFPLAALQKHLTKLNDDGFQVMIIEQEEDNPKKRFIRGVYSDNIRMEFEDDDSINLDRKIFCLLIERYVTRGSRVSQERFHLSLVGLEMNTGRVFLDFSDTEELDRALDGFLLRHQPQEVLVCPVQCKKEECALLEKSCRVAYDDDKFQPHEQIFYFRKAFSIPEVEDDAVVYLGLHRHQSLAECLGRTLRWVQGHDPLLMEKLQVPEFLPSEEVMRFNQDALQELHVLTVCDKRRHAVERHKQKSVFDILSGSMSIVGRRYFQRLLGTPLTQSQVLEKRFDLLEAAQKKIDQRPEDVAVLRSLPDLEWYLLRWRRGKLSVRLVATLLLTYDKLLKEVVGAWPEFFHEFHGQPKLKGMLEEVHKTWDLEKMLRSSNDNDHREFIRDNDAERSKTLDEFRTKLAEFESRVPTGRLVLDRERCLIQLTPRAWKLDWLKTGFYEIDKRASYVRIGHPELDKLGARYFLFMNEYTTFYRDLYLKASEVLLERYAEAMDSMNRAVAEVSCYLPLAVFFRERNYCRPVVCDSSSRSFVRVKDARHPIMEVIHPDDLFVPYSVAVGESEGPRGYLVYGINSSGKSTMLKSVGLCIWLAQCGLFVPAASMEFRPFDALYTKIGIQDNLFLGHSTFVAEMNELLYILQRASPRSFIMCDELTSGTETKSATGIVVATLLHFLEKSLCFFFTTHLHTVARVPEITNHSGLRICHFRIETQTPTKTDNLLVKNIRLRYDRVLRDGSGDDVYGIEIARSLGLPPAFIQQACSFRERVQVRVDPKEGIQVSRYNKRLVLTECMICGSDQDLHSHHITPQKEFQDKKHRHHARDGLYNLVSLCQKCHQGIHAASLPQEVISEPNAI